jgi:hypothetical protein
MKSKTAIAALAASLALCQPAKAITVDATHPLEMYFTDIPAVAYPVQLARITVTFGANPLNPGESFTDQIFDANHVLLDSYTMPSSGNTYSSLINGSRSVSYSYQLSLSVCGLQHVRQRQF